MRGPSDGFHIWNRWWGDDRYQSTTTPDENACQEMVRFLDTWSSVHQKPLLNKNNRNTEFADLLARVLPNAYFVHVTREPFFNIQSLIIARQRVQGDKRVGWGLGAIDNRDSGDGLGYVDDVCDQVFAARDAVERQRATIRSDRLLDIRYEDLCRAPERVVSDIANWVPGLSVDQSRISTELRPFTISDQIQLGEDEVRRIRERVARWQSRSDRIDGESWPTPPHDCVRKETPLHRN